jgi:uncharacterized protein (TIGR03000 family)
MKARRTLLMLTGAILLTATSPAMAQRGGHATASGNRATVQDVMRAYGFGANAGQHTGARLTPVIPNSGFNATAGGINANLNPGVPLIGAPNLYFPSQTTGFSTAPLFPYSSATFPYGYGFMAREPSDETQTKPPVALHVLTADSNSATMNVRVPADAEIWFEGSKTGQIGPTRTFVSPPLEPGRGFTYEVRARWTQNGKDVDQTRQVHVHAGDNVDVKFDTNK